MLEANYAIQNNSDGTHSDDYFADGSFAVIYNNAHKLLDNVELYALCFLKADFERKN